jgi:hypothetical protein
MYVTFHWRRPITLFDARRSPGPSAPVPGPKRGSGAPAPRSLGSAKCFPATLQFVHHLSGYPQDQVLGEAPGHSAPRQGGSTGHLGPGRDLCAGWAVRGCCPGITEWGHLALLGNVSPRWISLCEALKSPVRWTTAGLVAPAASWRTHLHSTSGLWSLGLGVSLPRASTSRRCSTMGVSSVWASTVPGPPRACPAPGRDGIRTFMQQRQRRMSNSSEKVLGHRLRGTHTGSTRSGGDPTEGKGKPVFHSLPALRDAESSWCDTSVAHSRR